MISNLSRVIQQQGVPTGTEDCMSPRPGLAEEGDPSSVPRQGRKGSLLHHRCRLGWRRRASTAFGIWQLEF